MNRPVRIQRKRTKGWKMPENTVYVGRPSYWGNPYSEGKSASERTTAENVQLFREAPRVENYDDDFTYDSYWREAQAELRGKNLACWCRLDQPCHADVLLEIANTPATAAATAASGGE